MFGVIEKAAEPQATESGTRTGAASHQGRETGVLASSRTDAIRAIDARRIRLPEQWQGIPHILAGYRIPMRNSAFGFHVIPKSVHCIADAKPMVINADMDFGPEFPVSSAA